ncbi:Inner membrane protein YnjI [Photorhabdus australis subsp. thailandensis]|uniref:Inner membrane protein YnjI n=1 Tax=Photorhabdus australis subsp. thailandensis TaxID=2805096 RepID=A0A1C0U6C4_9GAMM|nr:DUF1266 domain-containing protein [Photorhabdus australis]OCQ53474.1 Inner membrane protein YnjI [Photorhabdus australis subsp. thailandensis]
MAKELLQNQPHYRQFPVKGYQIIKNILCEKRKSPFLRLLYTVINILFVIAVGMGIILFVAIVLSIIGNVSVPDKDYLLLAKVGSVALLVVILLFVIIYRIVKRPEWEQQRYYQQAGLSLLPEEKRQALRLNIVSDYWLGFWSETLEHYPLQSRVAHDNYCYYLLPLSAAQEHQSQLYGDWGILDEEGYMKMLTGLWDGAHSKHFAVDAALSDGKMFKVLAKLVEVTPDYIRKCSRSVNGRPPALVWGFDLWLAIVLSRNCFCAGYISEEMAWKNMLKTADYIYEIFGNFDDFYINFLLGNAYWSNDFDRTKGRLEQFNYYKLYCDWPIAKLPWPEPKGVIMEREMMTGFYALVEEVLRNKIDEQRTYEIDIYESLAPRVLH